MLIPLLADYLLLLSCNNTMLFFRQQIEGVKMSRQEILKEKEIVSYMILGNIQKKHEPNQLYNLLVRQAWLSSESRKKMII